jgi:hypothetical protein
MYNITKISMEGYVMELYTIEYETTCKRTFASVDKDDNY